MKTIFKIIISTTLTLTFFCGQQSLLAQEVPLASVIKVSAEYSSSITDLKDLLMLENIDYHRIRFESPELKGKNFALRALEIWNGEVRDSALIYSSTQRKPIADSVFEVRVITKITEDKQIQIHFHTPGATSRKIYNIISDKSFLYNLRNVVRDSKQPVVFGKTFYFMAYILPIFDPNRPGWLSYCNVDNSGEDVREWGQKLGIEHYIVFEMVFH